MNVGFIIIYHIRQLGEHSYTLYSIYYTFHEQQNAKQV